MTGRTSPLMLLAIVAGFIIWSSAFTLLYAALSFGCTLGWQSVDVGPVSLNRLVLILVWAGHLAALGLLLQWCLRTRRDNASRSQPARFMATAALASTFCALFATLWTGLPITAVSTCV